LVEQKRASSTQIVAITFTEKAAWELKERIRLFFWPKRNSLQALHDLDRAPISDDSRVCGFSLARAPIDAGIDPTSSSWTVLPPTFFGRDVTSAGFPRRWRKIRLLSEEPLPQDFRSPISEKPLLFFMNTATSLTKFLHPSLPDIESLFRELATESESFGVWPRASVSIRRTRVTGRSNRFNREVQRHEPRRAKEKRGPSFFESTRTEGKPKAVGARRCLSRTTSGDDGRGDRLENDKAVVA